jgi:mannose-1-phosphate guanylyltransferase/mannose-6-phosphate isomerase
MSMIPVVLSGGSGTRLWPVSRASYPKQFCEFYDKSFLQNSLDRLRPLGIPLIVTVETMKTLTVKTAKHLGIPEDFLVFEPCGKNTAPAVALACHLLQHRGQGTAVVGIFPADHLIADEDEFLRVVSLGEKLAAQGEVVTLGIEPRYPSTGYGYIEVESTAIDQAGDLCAYPVKAFREKPDAEKAKAFQQSGRHYWNAGMFLFRVDTMIEHFQTFQPHIWQKISAIKPDMSNATSSYAAIESISLDYAIMEKLPSSRVCIPCSIGWSDVGSWDELARLGEAYPELRANTQAQVFTQDSASNFVFTTNEKVVGLIGMQGTIVVDTPDALLVCQKGHSEQVKGLVEAMQQADAPVTREHPFETRPWGGFEVLADPPHYKVKQITVDPGARLSYQSHERREEHWVIIAGQAEVTLDDQVHELRAGEHLRIPRRAKHRIKNSGRDTLVFVEVQTGEYFGEDDIIRYQDDYNRAT